MYFFVAVMLWFLFFFAIWYYKKLVLWLLFSPDYLLIIGAVGAFTVDHMGWLTSTRQAHYVWATLAMMAVGFGYHALNKWLYLRSAHTYKIVSFPFVVASCSSCWASSSRSPTRSPHAWPTIPRSSTSSTSSSASSWRSLPG